MHQSDIVILGAGPGGYVAAVRAAQRDATVTLVERDAVGGTCLNRGCIPTKALLATAEVYRHCKEAQAWGLSVEGLSYDVEAIGRRKDEVVTRLVTGIEKLIEKRKIRLVRGEGRLTGPRELTVRSADGEERIEARLGVIVATGSEEFVPPAFTVDGSRVITSREALERPRVPASVVIVGGGVIGVEFATWFHSMGAQVSIVEMMPALLPFADEQISRNLRMAFKKRKMKLHLGKRVSGLELSGEGVRVDLEGSASLEAEQVLVAIGRAPNVSGLGLEELGVNFDRKGIAVDEGLATNVPGIWAIGDVNGKVLLAHAASAQGIVAVDRILGGTAVADHRAVPSCVWSHPEIAWVGRTEQELKAQGIAHRVGTFSVPACGKAVAAGETEGIVKILVDEETDRLLGFHMVGHGATELVAEATLAYRLGLRGHDLVDTIHAHPTMAESIHEAVEAVYGLSIHGL